MQHSFCFSKFNEFLDFYLTLILSGMQFIFRYFNDIQYDRNLDFSQNTDFEVNPNLNRKPVKTAFFRWTRTEPESLKFGFSEPEPNLNLKNLVSMNSNRT